MLSMADGGIWWKAKIPPNKHAIAAYGTTIVGLPSQIDYAGQQKISQVIPPWHFHLTTLTHK